MTNQDIYTQENPEGHIADEECYYSLEDDSPESGPEQQHRGTKEPLLLLLKLITTPVEGWKSLKRSQCTPQKFAWECFYPLSLLAALSQTAALFYEADISVATVITLAVIVFMTLLLGNFGTILCCELFLPKGDRNKVSTPFGRVFVMAMVCTLAISVILWNLLPPIEPLIIFVPIYTIYLIVKGVKYLRVPEKSAGKVSIILSALVIGLPMILYTIFTELIP